MYCPKCGAHVEDGTNFCSSCGQNLSQFQDNSANTGSPAPQYTPPGYNQFTPSGYRAPIHQRSIPVAIILSIVTCGFYMLYWMYCIVNDLNTASGEVDDTGGGVVLILSIVTCDIYWLYWLYKAGRKVNKIQYLSGQREDSSLGILYLLLGLFVGIVAIALIQNELNKVAAD